MPRDPACSRQVLLFMSEQHKVVAIVDDDPTMLKAIERLLGAHGLPTQVFASAETFLDSDAPSLAACLVLDIHLAGISGIELCRRLKSVRSKLPVIFITAADDEATKEEAGQAGCVAYLRKPFPANLLMDEIRKATG